MRTKEVKSWKKVIESDYPYIVNEIKADIAGPSVIFLEGEMGAGKTTFTRYFTGEQSLSPTYSILTESKDIVHGDFYRLEGEKDLLNLDLPIYLEGKEFFLAEWGKQYFRSLLDFVPTHFYYYILQFDAKTENSEKRNLTFEQIDHLLS